MRGIRTDTANYHCCGQNDGISIRIKLLFRKFMPNRLNTYSWSYVLRKMSKCKIIRTPVGFHKFYDSNNSVLLKYDAASVGIVSDVSGQLGVLILKVSKAPEEFFSALLTL